MSKAIKKLSYDEKGNLHSYDDLPIRDPEDKSSKKWYKHGILHRDNDKPAVIMKFAFFKTIQRHYIEGVQHRVNGKQMYANYGKGFQNYALYGFELEKEIFKATLAYTEETKLPLWASLLATTGVVADADIKNLLLDYDNQVPVSWYFKALGIIDDNSFLNGILLDYKDSLLVEMSSTYHLERMLKVIEYENNLTTTGVSCVQ